MRNDAINALKPLIVVVAAFIIWKPLVLPMVPGILLLYSLRAEKDTILKLVFMSGASLGFWAVTFWYLKYLPISLTSLYYAVFAATAIGLAIAGLLYRLPVGLSFDKETLAVIGVFVAIAIIKFIPFFTNIVPAGADMSMHTYITSLIVVADGIPASYMPILNIDTFDIFPVGFHTVSALISLTGAVESYRAAFILTGFTYLFLASTLYVLVRPHAGWKIALVTSIWFTVLNSDPLGFVGWGGNPTVFALAFIVLLVVALLGLFSGKREFIPFAAFFLAGAFLTHTIIFVQAFYLLVVSFLVYILYSRKLSAANLFSLFLFMVCFLFITAPYLFGLEFGFVTESTKVALKEWITKGPPAVPGSGWELIRSVPHYMLKKQLAGNTFKTTSIVLLSLYALFITFKTKRDICYLYATFFIMCVILVLNSKWWVLPISYLIYPERVTIMTIIPLGIFFSVGLKAFFEKIPITLISSARLRGGILFVAVGVFVIFSVHYNQRGYVKLIADNSAVTEDDMRGFEWLEENSSQTDLIATNYGDAGLWIPGVIMRQVTKAHVNIAYQDKIKKAGTSPRYLFIGSKCVYEWACGNSYERYAENDRYEHVFHSGGTHIFRYR